MLSRLETQATAHQLQQGLIEFEIEQEQTKTRDKGRGEARRCALEGKAEEEEQQG